MSFLEGAQSTNPDLHNSSASLHVHNSKKRDVDFGSCAASLNRASSPKDGDVSLSRSFHPFRSELEQCNVKITQFDDDAPTQVESAESLPDHVDRKGRCVHHPSVRLYKKQLLGGFQLILDKCPHCDASNCDNMVAEGAWGQASIASRPHIVLKRSMSASRSDSRGKSEVYTRASSAERRAASYKNDWRKAVSESEVSRGEGTSFLEQAPDRRKAPSENGEKRATTPNKRRSGKALSENGVGSRPSTSAFIDDKPQSVSKKLYKYMDTSLKGGSPNNKPKSFRKTFSESNARPSTDSPFIDDSPSFVLWGLEKLSLINAKNRSTSRSRSERVESSARSTASNKSSKSDGRSCKSDGRSCKSDGNGKSTKSGKSKRQWDKTGRCRKHPSIILAKKKPFAKGWDMLRDSCPFCAEVGSEVSFSKMNLSSLNGKEDYNASKQRSSSDGGPTEDRKSKEDTVDKMPQDENRVYKMPFTHPGRNAEQESGWYTGSVDEFGKPHGTGRMRTKTGNVYDGSWNHGYSEQYLEKQNRIKSGFGSNIAPWKQNVTSPHYEPTPGGYSPSPPHQGPSFMMQAHLMPPPPLQFTQRAQGQRGGQYPAESAPLYWQRG